MAESNAEYRRHMKGKQDVYRVMEQEGILRLLEWDVERDKVSGLTELQNKRRNQTVCPARVYKCAESDRFPCGTACTITA